MLGQWRLILRQAHEAARAGRFDEARAILARPEVADRRQALELRRRIGTDLVGRGRRALRGDDLATAWDDLQQAERWGVPGDELAPLRRGLSRAVVREARDRLNAADPVAAERAIDRLREGLGTLPDLRRLDVLAHCWVSAWEHARGGEFARAAEALAEAERLAPTALVNPIYRFWAAPPLRGAIAALARARTELETRRARAGSLVRELHEALDAGRWPDVLSVAADLLAVAPEHLEARRARAAAWSRVNAASVDRAAAAGPDPTRRTGPKFDCRPRPALRHEPAPDRFLVWADAVGGYLVCLGDAVTIGQATPDGPADVPILGDLSRVHATIRRDDEGYVLHAARPTTVNGKAVDSVPLQSGDLVRLGSVELRFTQPNPLSLTAQLEVCSAHRLPLAVDAVILMADTWILGAADPAAEPTEPAGRSVVLYRQAETLWCRAAGSLEIDGRRYQDRGPLGPRSAVRGIDGAGATPFSFSLEPLGSRLLSLAPGRSEPPARPAPVG